LLGDLCGINAILLGANEGFATGRTEGALSEEEYIGDIPRVFLEITDIARPFVRFTHKTVRVFIHNEN
jgi:hypothetical protein